MEDDDAAIEREERGIYLIVLVAGLPIIGALLIEQRAIDGGNTLILVMVALSLVGLVAGLKLARLPRARAIKSSDPESGTPPPPR